MNSYLKGSGVALVTPFMEGGEIDFPALDRVVDYVIQGGVNYLVALGTTAETPTLSPDERDAVVDRIRNRNAGRVPIVVGIGGNNTRAVMASIARCDLSGISAILSVTPFYNKPSQRGLYEHYRAVAGASPLPVILYNVPGRTGVNMLPQTTLRLASEVENIVAVKEACGSLDQFRELLAGRPQGFYVTSGDDATALPLVEMGGDGVISVAANAFPGQVSSMIRTALDGQHGQARQMYSRLDDMVKLLFEEGNPTGVKAALHAKGVIENVLRLPLVESSAGLYERISSLVVSEGL